MNRNPSRLVILGPGLNRWRRRFEAAKYDTISVGRAEYLLGWIIKFIRPFYDHITVVAHRDYHIEGVDASVAVNYRGLKLTGPQGQEELKIPSLSSERFFLEVWAWLTDQFFPDDLTIP